MKFETGTVVQLKSGGPEMTISGIIGDAKNPIDIQTETELKDEGYADGDVECMWFVDNNILKTRYFKAAMLVEKST